MVVQHTEGKPKNRIEKATENFCAVRDHFLNEDRGTSQAYRMAFKKPMKFYHEHTPAEAVEILKREAMKETVYELVKAARNKAHPDTEKLNEIRDRYGYDLYIEALRKVTAEMEEN